MKTAYYSQYGGPEKLQIVEREEPTQLKPGSLLVKVHAAALNPVDYKMLKGNLSIVQQLPCYPGFDVAGTVIKAGANCERLKPGDEIWGMASHRKCGAFAQRCVIEERFCGLKPKNLDFEQAAGGPLVGITTWQSLVKTAKLKSGNRLLILGGSTANGLFAIQLAKHLGCHIAVTCSHRNIKLCKSLGAGRAFDYTKENWWESLKKGDIDVIYDCIGSAQAFHASQEVLLPSGHFVTIVGDVGGAALSPTRVMRAASVIAARLAKSTLGMAPKYNLILGKTNFRDLDRVRDFMASGHYQAVIDSKYPLTDIALAFKRSISGRASGKIILTM